MPRESATDKKADEKAEVQPKVEIAKEPVETQLQIEEIPPSELSENSTVETAENPIEEKNKRFVYKWILAIFALILIILFFVNFENIQNLFLTYESRFYVGGGITIALFVGLLVWYVPKRQVKKLENKPLDDKLTEFEREKERLKLENDTRKTLAQIVGGVFLIAGLFVTYNTYRLGIDNYQLGLKQQEINAQKQDLDRRGQITDRFNKAVTNLGTPDLSVRLGGLYALEQILKDSPEDRTTIIEVLSAYIREKAKKNVIEQPNKSGVSSTKSPIEESTTVTIDIQTALTILSRSPDEDIRRLEKSGIDLSNANLSGAKLFGNFRAANLSNVNLSGADLSNSDFANANFYNANLSGANLGTSNLSNANLSDANLNGVKFDDFDFDKDYPNPKTNGLTEFQLGDAKFEYIYLYSEGEVWYYKTDRDEALKFFREKEKADENKNIEE